MRDFRSKRYRNLAIALGEGTKTTSRDRTNSIIYFRGKMGEATDSDDRTGKIKNISDEAI